MDPVQLGEGLRRVPRVDAWRREGRRRGLSGLLPPGAASSCSGGGARRLSLGEAALRRMPDSSGRWQVVVVARKLALRTLVSSECAAPHTCTYYIQ